jgi:hypothetical protein
VVPATDRGKEFLRGVLRANYGREAILAPDDRGGAMALTIATEMAYGQSGL